MHLQSDSCHRWQRIPQQHCVTSRTSPTAAHSVTTDIQTWKGVIQGSQLLSCFVVVSFFVSHSAQLFVPHTSPADEHDHAYQRRRKDLQACVFHLCLSSMFPVCLCAAVIYNVPCAPEVLNPPVAPWWMCSAAVQCVASKMKWTVRATRFVSKTHCCSYLWHIDPVL